MRVHITHIYRQGCPGDWFIETEPSNGDPWLSILTTVRGVREAQGLMQHFSHGPKG
jgi:hypothetical protein